MPIDVRDDLFGPLQDDVVRSFREDHQLGAWEKGREPSPDRDGTDRVRVSPQEEHGSSDLAEPLAEVFSLVGEPARQGGIALPEPGTPVLGAERRDIDTARRDREHQVPYQARLLERGPDRDDPTHRLREQRHRPGDVTNHSRDEIVDSADAGLLRRAAESGPGQEASSAGMTELRADWPPELDVTGGARQDHQTLGLSAHGMA